MDNPHEIPKAIQWHEGMLLSPHHFQQMVLRQDQLLHYHINSMAPFSWGVRRLTINQSLLVAGTLQIVELEAIMPDGTLVVYGNEGDSQGPLQADLTPFMDEMKQTLATVHLALPAKKHGQNAFKGDLARYDSQEGREIVDENTGENEIQIPRLQPRLTLIVAETPPQKFVSFPLARASYANESFSADEFIPPTLSVSLQSPLGAMCSQIAKRLREKAVFLSYEVLAPSSTSGMPLMLETKTLIQTMVASLPMFEAILNTGKAHPFQLYLGLCQLVGNLAALGTLVPPVLQPYDHNDPLGSFQQAQQYIFRMIEEGVHEAYMNIPFYFEDEMFGAKFDSTYMDKPVYLGVRGQPGMSEKDVCEWIEKSWVGSSSKIQGMRDKRILGPERKHLERVDDLVPARGVQLFSLQVDPAYIIPDETLHVYNTTSIGPRPTEIVMYVKKKS